MKRRRLWWLGVGMTILVAIGAALILSVRIITTPTLDKPSRADAIVVLSGDRGERLPRALSLLRQGVAPTLVIDGLPDLPEAKSLCASSTEFETVCLRPQPDTTRTEARAAGKLALERGWHRLVVVTDKIHVARTRLLFDRCVSGSIAVVSAPPYSGYEQSWQTVRHEWLGLLYARTVSRGC